MNLSFLLWVIPAYIANSTATFSKFLPWKRHPVDFGRKWVDGRRILGDGKTFEGIIIGTTLGALSGYLIFPLFNLHYNPVLIALGALLGDMVGSFAKRRLDLPRGSPAPVLDQLDFILGALMLAGPFTAQETALIIIITPIIHRVANIIGYLIGVKNEPW